MKPDEERIRQEILGAVVRRPVNTPAPPEEPASPGATGDTPLAAPPTDPRPGPPSHNRGRPVLLAVVVIVVVTLVLVYLLKGRTGDVSGDVFVTMKSGDVKRGADVQVLVVPRTKEFEAAWKREVDEFVTAHAEASRVDRDAKAAYEEANRTASVASARAIEGATAQVRAGNYRASFLDDPEYRASQARVTQAFQATLEYRAVRALARHQVQALALLAKQSSHRARTDVNGHYEIKALPAGKYYVCATHKVFDNELFWMVSTELAGPVKVDLTNSNAGWAIAPP